MFICRLRRSLAREWATWSTPRKRYSPSCPADVPMLNLKRARAQAKNRLFPRRGIYLLPNLFTTGALFAGFFAIVQGMNQRFELAAQAVFVAMVLDGLDGRVARLTRTQS